MSVSEPDIVMGITVSEKEPFDIVIPLSVHRDGSPQEDKKRDVIMSMRIHSV